MPDDSIALSGDLDVWLSGLAPAERSLVDEVVASHDSLEDAARAWLGGTAGVNLAPYGASRGGSVFFDRFVNEIRELLCTNSEKYANERSELQTLVSNGKQAVAASSITLALASTLGIAAALLGPAIAVMLALIAKMGVRAWCSSRAPQSSPED